MKHILDIKIAEEVGVVPAIILENLAFWIKKNQSEGKNYKKGKYWSYTSIKGLKIYFPYLTIKQIEYAINKLKEANLIIKDIFNKNPNDRTSWYALTAKAEEILGITFPKIRECKDEIQEMYILDKDINKNIIPPNPQGEEEDFYNLSFKENNDFKKKWSEWKKHTKEIKKKISKTQLKALSEAFETWGVVKTLDNIQKSILRGYSAIIDLSEQAGKENITLEMLIKAYKYQINANLYSFNELSDSDQKIIKSKSIEEFKARCFDYSYICNELSDKTSKLRKAIK